MSDYGLLKLIHIGSLILWLGPALGAWLVLRALDDKNFAGGAVAAKVSRVFYVTVIIEHVAFVGLLTSGFYLAHTYHFFGSPWLTQKLAIVLLIIVPLEVVDIILGNWLASTASKKAYAGIVLTSWERRGLEIYHGAFTKIALLVLPIAVLLILYLATSKTAILPI